MSNKKSLAVIGIGRWGKNLLREFHKISNIRFCYHRGNPKTRAWLKLHYPNIAIAASFNQIITDPTVDAVVIATPIKTHFGLAKKALAAGKHIFIEKPITQTVKQAEELVKLTKKMGAILFVGHLFLYHPVFAKLKTILKKDHARYAAFAWNKFGTFEEALGPNLLSHELSIAFALFGKPKKIKVIGQYGFITDCDMLSLRIYFGNGFVCNLCINRISNTKNKSVTLATSKNVYLWENDRLFKLDNRKSLFKPLYRAAKTPLEIECREFVNSITYKKEPWTSGSFGLEIIKLLSRVKV